MVAAVGLALACIGLYGILTRRDVVAVLASIEVLLGGALVLFAGLGASAPEGARIEATLLLVLVIAAAEAAVGLALLVVVARRKRTTRLDELTEVRG